MTETEAREVFVGEEITPVPGAFDARGMAAGEPGLPAKFVWRGKEHEVEAILEKWKETGRCRSGGDEFYVRKHWFKIRTTGSEMMKIYFERQPRSRRKTARWWLYTVGMPKPDAGAAPPAQSGQ